MRWAHFLGAVGGLLLGWIFTFYNKRKRDNPGKKSPLPARPVDPADSYYLYGEDTDEMDDEEEIDDY